MHTNDQIERYESKCGKCLCVCLSPAKDATGGRRRRLPSATTTECVCKQTTNCTCEHRRLQLSLWPASQPARSSPIRVINPRLMYLPASWLAKRWCLNLRAISIAKGSSSYRKRRRHRPPQATFVAIGDAREPSRLLSSFLESLVLELVRLIPNHRYRSLWVCGRKLTKVSLDFGAKGFSFI